ncbi:MAG: TonB-dependent receptor, partial [Comamonadaceae bacterium]
MEANLQGRLLTLPAGEARFAAGLAYREDGYDFLPDSLVMGGDVIGMLAQTPLSGSTNVKEIYGEVLLPLLKDLPFVDSLEIGLGYRYSDYSSVGGVQSYKIDGDWQVVPSLRLRAENHEGTGANANAG